MRMIGYLGGDANTLVARKAVKHDVRVAVEFEDDNRMLTFFVMQDGAVMMGFNTIRAEDGVEPTNDIYLLGHVYKQGAEQDGPLYYLPDGEPPVAEGSLAEIHFLPLPEDVWDDDGT